MRWLRAMEANLPPAVRWTQPAGGFCSWLTLPRHRGLADIVGPDAAAGVGDCPGRRFLAQPSSDLHVRLCFGNLPAER